MSSVLRVNRRTLPQAVAVRRITYGLPPYNSQETHAGPPGAVPGYNENVNRARQTWPHRHLGSSDNLFTTM